jgi:hypothetical protein
MDVNNSGIYLAFTTDFFGCINACAEWNLNQSTPCVGVSYSAGNYSPLGPMGGAQCVLMWTAQGPAHSAGTYDALLMMPSANVSAPGSQASQTQTLSSPANPPSSGGANIATFNRRVLGAVILLSTLNGLVTFL